jgi:hypothetical protein
MLSVLRVNAADGSDGDGEAADAVAELAQTVGGQVGERFFLLLRIAETRDFHLLGGSLESLGANIVHGEETEGLGKRYPIRPGMQELDVGGHFPKHSTQAHLSSSPLRNRALGKDGRASGKRKAPNHSDKPAVIDGE